MGPFDHRFIDSLMRGMAHWLIRRFAASFLYSLIDSSIDSLIGALIDSLIDTRIDSSTDPCAHWSTYFRENSNFGGANTPTPNTPTPNTRSKERKLNRRGRAPPRHSLFFYFLFRQLILGKLPFSGNQHLCKKGRNANPPPSRISTLP